MNTRKAVPVIFTLHIYTGITQRELESEIHSSIEQYRPDQQ